MHFTNLSTRLIQIRWILKKKYFSRDLYGKKGFKYFIGYKDKIKPFCVRLPNMSEYAKYFKTKYISFLIKDGKLLTAYNNI